MGPYRPRVELALLYTTPSQSEIDRSVELGISTLCGEISILVICTVFVPGLSELDMYVWIDYDPWMGPYRPQMTVTICTIPGQ